MRDRQDMEIYLRVMNLSHLGLGFFPEVVQTLRNDFTACARAD